MIVLAIDTATPQVSVALGGPDKIWGSFSAATGKRHSETLAPAIALLTDATGITLAQVDRVAVDVGPGLFTGLRVGLATAAALATALERPAVAMTSLDLLFYPQAGGHRAVATLVDARRGEVFWALYRPGTGRVSEPVVAAPHVVAAALAELGEDVLALGDGAARYRDILLGAPGRPPAEGGGRIEVRDGYPSAVDLVALAAGRPTVAPAELRPQYLREADVRIGWPQRAPQAVTG
jgi:tRNA threonylcarbamoyladenosine biosynthesis protein TsaB